MFPVSEPIPELQSTVTDDRDRFQRLSDLFEEARDLSREDAGRFVAGVSDPWLRSELAAMLELDRSGAPTVRTLVDLGQILDEVEQPIEVPSEIGEYAVLGVIGLGASGVVLKARQPGTDRIVAIKVLASGGWNPSALTRFRREIRLLGRLEHPGIARIYGAGSDTSTIPHRPYFVMEYIDGVSLTAWARDGADGSRRSPAEIVHAFAEIVDAIGHAHAAGVIHRDLKPGNVLIGRDGHPKLLDFGVSGLADAAGTLAGSVQAALTLAVRTGQESVVGTVPYMSPEQFEGAGSVDARSDLYALGVMLFECLAGRLPYPVERRSLPEAAALIREELPTTLGRVNRAFRGDLETVVSRLLEKDPDRRYQSAEELAADLRLYLSGKPTRTRPVSRLERARRFMRRYRGLIAATAVAFAVLLGFLGYTLVLWRESEQRGSELARALETSERLEYRRSIRDAEAALRAGVVLDSRRALSSVPKDRRGWEWRYLAARAGAESAVTPVPEMPIAIRTHGDFVLVGGLNGGVFRFESGRSEAASLAKGKASATEIAVSPDGRAFVVADAGEPTLPIRSTIDGALLRQLPLPFAGTTSVDWSADGARIAVAGSLGVAAVIDAATGEPVRSALRGFADVRRAEGLVRFLPDGNGIVIGCRASPHVVIHHDQSAAPIPLDLAGGVVERVGVARGRGGARVLVGLYNGEIAVFDARFGEPVRRIRAHDGALRTLEPGPGPFEFTSGATDGSIHVWDVDTGERVGAAVGAELQVRGVAHDAPRQELLSVGEDGFVRRWSISKAVREPVLREHRAWVYSLLYLDDDERREGTLVSGAGEAPAPDGRVIFWNLAGRSVERAAHPIGEGAVNIVWSLSADPKGGVAVASGRGIQFVSRDGAVTEFPLPTAPYCVAVVDGGERIAVRRFECADLELYDRTGALLQTIGLPSAVMGDMRSRQDGRTLLLSAGAALLRYRFEDGRLIEDRRVEFEGRITSLSPIEASDRVAVGFFGGDVALVDLGRSAGDEVLWRTLASPDDNVRVALSPDGARVASVGKGPLVRILDGSDGEQVLALGGHGDTVISIVFSPDGGTLATGSIDGTIRLWRAASSGFSFGE
ncbi:MAG: protein kinase [Phycisphaera sp.]|nr:protein kinase [Phycisphaera sp.]